jgi:hypothetical protein
MFTLVMPQSEPVVDINISASRTSSVKIEDESPAPTVLCNRIASSSRRSWTAVSQGNLLKSGGKAANEVFHGLSSVVVTVSEFRFYAIRVFVHLPEQDSLVRSDIESSSLLPIFSVKVPSAPSLNASATPTGT